MSVKDFLPVVICAIITRCMLLPFTLKTERYFTLIRSLSRTLNIRINIIKQKFSENPQKAYIEEICDIDKSIDLNQKNRKPLLFIIPILIQISILFIVLQILWGKYEFKSELFSGWVENLSSKDPYYVFPFILFISLIIKQKICLPYKKKILLYIFDFILLCSLLNFPAGFVLFLICLSILSTVQSYVLSFRSKGLIIVNEGKTTSLPTDFNLKNWLFNFKKKTSLIEIDDVIISLFFVLIVISIIYSSARFLIFVLILIGFYYGNFYLQQERQWRA